MFYLNPWFLPDALTRKCTIFIPKSKFNNIVKKRSQNPNKSIFEQVKNIKDNEVYDNSIPLRVNTNADFVNKQNMIPKSLHKVFASPTIHTWGILRCCCWRVNDTAKPLVVGNGVWVYINNQFQFQNYEQSSLITK